MLFRSDIENTAASIKLPKRVGVSHLIRNAQDFDTWKKEFTDFYGLEGSLLYNPRKGEFKILENPTWDRLEAADREALSGEYGQEKYQTD